MCFAFKDTTVIDDRSLEDILATGGSKSADNASHPPPASASPSSTMANKSSKDRNSASEDCVMLDVPPQNKTLTKVSEGHGTMQRAGSVESEYIARVNNDDESTADDTSQSVQPKKRQAESVAMSEIPKKAKTAAGVQRPKPSGKGWDYDDLCYRSNIAIARVNEDKGELEAALTLAVSSRDDGIAQILLLKQQLESHKAANAAIEAKKAADLKAAVQKMETKQAAELKAALQEMEARQGADLKAAMQKMKIVLRGETEKKHKAQMESRDKRHKEDRQREKDLNELLRAAKYEAKALNPEHSDILKGKEKKIAALKADKVTLEAVAQTSRIENTQLKVKVSNLTTALSDNADEILELKIEVKKQSQELALRAEEKKIQGQKWQIQYDNSQESARRASDAKRNAETLSRALNVAIEARTGLENQLKDAKVEISLLRQGIFKGESAE